MKKFLYKLVLVIVMFNLSQFSSIVYSMKEEFDKKTVQDLIQKFYDYSGPLILQSLLAYFDKAENPDDKLYIMEHIQGAIHNFGEYSNEFLDADEILKEFYKFKTLEENYKILALIKEINNLKKEIEDKAVGDLNLSNFDSEKDNIMQNRESLLKKLEQLKQQNANLRNMLFEKRIAFDLASKAVGEELDPEQENKRLTKERDSLKEMIKKLEK